MVKEIDVVGVNKSFQTMEVENTRAIAEDYIKYRLQSSGFVWENGRQGNVTPNSVEAAMRSLGDEFEERFRSHFDDMIGQLHVTEDNAHDTFSSIVSETFSDGVNWGRIVALFGFAGRFAVQCFENNLPHVVDNIVEWVTAYVDNNLSTWMSSHNNWEGFLEFHAGGPESRKNNPWPSFGTICGYAAAGIGVLTLGAFLTQKS
ncbi:bcl-2-like protein 2 [Aplysia californica]|uniref:Bcl-2-like protein 2 n=1 Tax=Aplysia californica TaxID=6500 RepID=A0ABM0JXC4_APLCA|nr:bcl-2-like protein 2 [Aplysia californica]